MFGSIKKRSRLGQWDGRRRSSRCDGVFWPALTERPTLLRLTMVLLTVVAVTAVLYSNGPPMPFSVGQTCPRDVRVRVPFQVINLARTEQLREELIFHRQAEGIPITEAELNDAVPPVVDRFWPGMTIVKRQQPINETQLVLLQKEHRAYINELRSWDHARRATALLLIHLILASMVTLYVIRYQPSLAECPRKILSVCVLVILTVVLAHWLSRSPWNASIVPLTVTALILTIAYNPPFALFTSFCIAISVTLARGADLGYLLILMSGMGTAILLLRNVRTRTRPVQVAFGAGLAYAVMTCGTYMLTDQTVQRLAQDSGRFFLWSLLAGFIIAGSLPLIERCFGVVTDVSLLELADNSHPLMQELIRRAPGTYTHSVTVATLAESAAEAIGANPLLTRVGSYYHDIGKMLKPHYFIENQTGENRHDSLEPALSTLVIIGHVKDGVALAEQYRLPQPIVDFIQQHHGTTLVEYFYREAMRLQEANGGNSELEYTFRYPGPKPQSRETGILMLADCVESASRALSNPTPSSLRKLVHDLLMKRLLDGQFDESGLTLTELHLVEEALGKSLTALFHARIKYPAPSNPPSGTTPVLRQRA